MDTVIGMGHADFDDLEFARQQLYIAVAELAESAMSPELRVQLGLLAAQVALADRLSAALSLENGSAASDSGDSPPDPEAIADGIEWTTALAEKILRTSTPGGFRLVQALVAEGGSASVDKLVDLTGDAVLRSATQSLNMAARRAGIVHQLPDGRLIQAYRYPNPITSKVSAYTLPAESVLAFSAAVSLLDELHRRIHETRLPTE
ncbi:hypothetical protein [Nocardia pseudovaccinii]|uniref:hypothetical protein n=1 Tax=Nocardia pseudovaccinii TaxID=189540 RepID=UPI0007A4FCD8|nr:hypothetical protein [Nocardia pseudovaccinii]